MVEGNAKPLLSRSTAKLLGVLRINADYVAGQDEFSDRLVDKFLKLWDGISSLHGQQLQLHINPSVLPIATKHNQVTSHRMEKVEKEIQKLVDADIIERVTNGPTEWVLRIVTRVLWYYLFGRWHLSRSKEGGGSEEITGTKECVRGEIVPGHGTVQREVHSGLWHCHRTTKSSHKKRYGGKPK